MARRILGTRATLAASSVLLIASSLVACGSDTEDGAPAGGYGAPASEPATANGAEGEDGAAEGEDGADGEAEATAASEIRVSGFEFAPSSITISVGDTVTWVFDDGQIPHDAISRDPSPEQFRSPTIREDSWSFTFTEPGEYPYFCSIHPQMTGTVIVEE
ncbi:cupredoxin family copper-binding protein [Hoyosella sp. G463]|uniref:Cupredoxin family copper-binding protein n=1 Tax=Lolliginicoccus lacisalsi TaxID=2742202 RepID=A0A927JBW2_9ACTN|nr:cupredoxin family copper-binding protein [Lolliginicoccus lacisalsi]MBD8506248.1 cupredoxin family copper-binding protein [Lolliginicoccus lacisalsi]